MAIRAVLFDYGMVLSAPPNAAALQQMLDLSGVESSLFQEHYWRHRHEYDRGTLNSRTYWQAIAAGAGFALDASKNHALVAADIRMWTDLNHPMVDWAVRLPQAGYRTGILSNIGDGFPTWMLANFDWLRHFHHCTWSWELGLIKPDVAIYQHAAAGLGCDPSEILFIDDKEENIAGAKAAGLQGLVYANHAGFLEQMQQNGYEKLLAV
ncbi:MAG: HAD family hydrolase [Acidobacteriaceae bacterium]